MDCIKSQLLGKKEEFSVKTSTAYDDHKVRLAYLLKNIFRKEML
jgi:hypothetical protein